MSIETHEVSPEEVMAFVDGELSPARAAAVSSHLEACSGCTALVADFQGLSQKMADWVIGKFPLASLEAGDSSGLSDEKTRGSVLADASRRRHPSALNWTVIGFSGLVSLVLIAVAIPNLLRSRIGANEASAVGSLRTLNSANSAYVTSYGHYPPSLWNLGPSQNNEASAGAANLIDSGLAGGQKSGYVFTYRSGAKGTYTINADPKNPGSAGIGTFPPTRRV